MIWTINSEQAVTMQATSKSWNWVNIGIFVALGVLGILAIGIVTVFLVTQKPKKKVAPTISRKKAAQLPTSAKSPNVGIVSVERSPQSINKGKSDASNNLLFSEVRSTSTPNWLVAIGARSLLDDVNRFILKDVGEIYESENEIYLEWFSVSGKSDLQSIHIRLINHQEININGKVFPATHEGLKSGIATCLREMSKPRTP